MRSVDPAAVAAMQTGTVPIAVLIEMQLETTLRVTLADASIDYGGHTWTGVGVAGSIDPILDAAGERKGVKLTLSSVPTGMLSLALEESMLGKPVFIYVLVGDPSTYAPITADLRFSGTLGQPEIKEGDGSGVVTVAAESASVTFRRIKYLRYTHADQQRLYPGDTSLRFITSQANHQDIWPSAKWGRK